MTTRPVLAVLSPEVLLELCRREPEFERRYDASTWQPLGEGRFGCVGRLLDRDLGCEVAVKLFWRVSAEMRQRIQAEVRNAQRIRSESVVHVHTVHFGCQAAWMQMELVDGHDLEHELALRARDRKPFPLEEALECAQAAVEGLAQAHAAGVVHRDVKPSNYLMPRSRKPFLKLGDFGVSKHFDAARLTATGDFPGTPAYAPPEVFEGRPAGMAGDVYSLAVVLYRVLTNGEHPYDLPKEATPMDYLRWHRSGRPRRLVELNSAVPESLAAVLDRALVKDPDERPTAAVIGEALRRAQNHAREPQAAAPRRQRLRRARATALACGIALAVTLAGGWALNRPGRAGGERERASATAPGPAAAPLAVVEPAVASASLPSPSVPPALRRSTPRRAVAPAESPARRVEPVRGPARTDNGDARHSGAPQSERQGDDSAAAPPPTVLPATSPAREAPSPPSASEAAPGRPGPGTTGALALVVMPTSEVVVDGRTLGVMASRTLTLSTGRHSLRILHPDYEPLPRVVTIEPGSTLHLVVDLNEKGIRRRPR